MQYQLKKLEQGIRARRILEDVFVVGRRVSFTMKGFDNIYEIYYEGSFMAQCGLWHRMGSISVAVPHGENKRHDEIGKDKMLYK